MDQIPQQPQSSPENPPPKYPSPSARTHSPPGGPDPTPPAKNAFRIHSVRSMFTSGFLEDAVFEDPTLSSAQISDSYNGANDGSHDQLNGIDDKEMGQHVDVADVQSEPSSASVAPIDVRNEIAEEVTANVGDLKLTDDDSANQSTGEDQHPLSAEGVDMLLEKCLLQALHTTVKDKDLPMPGSTLWSNYVLPCRPSGITLDIKKSSHKKLSKWLQAKCSTGLIRVKEDKYKKESVLLSIDRSHPDYSSFKPEKQQVEEAACSNWCSCCADTGELYSASDATDIVFKYVEKENLVKPTDKSIVILDAILCDALFKGAIKKGSTLMREA
ncbi:eukaryotic translation initiation factor 2D [Rosa chinensis]|uniref:eukaryotic translation initiation factor 2D n=1 Tax=Rosa chinensis TaxID=74649 RepID=UPI000D09256E|nr:eukaryotic translation initiation factor 2D [Rosa chinensis]